MNTFTSLFWQPNFRHTFAAEKKALCLSKGNHRQLFKHAWRPLDWKSVPTGQAPLARRDWARAAPGEPPESDTVLVLQTKVSCPLGDAQNLCFLNFHFAFVSSSRSFFANRGATDRGARACTCPSLTLSGWLAVIYTMRRPCERARALVSGATAQCRQHLVLGRAGVG